jgi:hypothetical protein
MLLTHLRPQMTEADSSANAELLGVLHVGVTCGIPTRRCRIQWTRSTSELALLALLRDNSSGCMGCRQLRPHHQQ